MANYLETLLQGGGAALLLLPIAAEVARNATRRLIRRGKSVGPEGPELLPELETAFDEIETLLGEIHTTIENNLAEQTPHSQSERAVAEAGSQVKEITDSIQGIVDEVKALTDPSPSSTASNEASHIPVPAVLQEMMMFGGRRRARIYLSTGTIFDTSGQDYSIVIVGNRGAQHLTFTSGTPQTAMVNAFNQFHSTTGVVAVGDQGSGQTILLTSLRKGPHQFVGAKKISGNRHDIILNEDQANGADQKVDFGE